MSKLPEYKMIARRIDKQSVQAMVKALRAADLPVVKSDYGYKCEVQGRVIFQAMNGNHDYLVRMADNLFS